MGATAAGFAAPINLHVPDGLVQRAWRTLGHIRTIHLNALACDWAP